MFLQETKYSEAELKIIGGKVWRGSEAIAMDAKGAAGGIGILWNPREVSLSDFYATQFSLSPTFHILGTSTMGFMTNVYRPPRAEQKVQCLESLVILKRMSKRKLRMKPEAYIVMCKESKWLELNWWLQGSVLP